jgi:hypothetical protein
MSCLISELILAWGRVAKPVAVPIQNFDDGSGLIAKNDKMPGEDISFQVVGYYTMYYDGQLQKSEKIVR